MFDFGFSEMLVVAVIALVVLGPERLPVVARTAGEWIGKAQRFVAQVKSDIDRETQLSELKQLKDEAQSMVDSLQKDVQAAADEMQSSVKDAADEAAAAGPRSRSRLRASLRRPLPARRAPTTSRTSTAGGACARLRVEGLRPALPHRALRRRTRP